MRALRGELVCGLFLGVTQRTAWFMLHRIPEAWAASVAEPMLGPMEADETYVGGKAKNMHASRRRDVIVGRGPAGKAAVAGSKTGHRTG